MGPVLTRVLVPVFFLVMSASLLPPLAAARDNTAGRGAKGPIGREELERRLGKAVLGGPAVTGYVIRGEDLVAILSKVKAGTKIRIKNSVIEGGLVFPPILAAALIIVDSEIRPAPNSRAPWSEYVFYARGVRFLEAVVLRDTTFAGPVTVRDARFVKTGQFSGGKFLDYVDFGSATFDENVDFSLVEFHGVDFNDTVFRQKSRFLGAKFMRPAKFDGTVFENDVTFFKAVFDKDQTFFANFHGSARFRKAKFGGAVNFASKEQTAGSQARASFAGAVSFKDAEIAGAADFSGLTFRKDADFSGVKMVHGADFPRSRFEQRANFLNASFGVGNFHGADFSGPASFQSAAFGLTADFTDATFTEDARFYGARFGELAFFTGISVGRFGSFRTATFADEASFDGTKFGESADFQGTCFADRLTFTNAKFGGFADFRDASIAKLELYSVYNPSIFKSRFDLRGAHIFQTQIQDILFTGNVDFSDAAFGVPQTRCRGREGAGDVHGTTLFRHVTFNDDVRFVRTRFSGRLAMDNVKFAQEADFTDASFSGILKNGPPSFSLSYVDFSKLQLSWRQLPDPRVWVASAGQRIKGSLKPLGTVTDPERVSRIIGKLESQFRDRKQLGDANEAYYHKKRAALREARADGWSRPRLWLEAEWIFWGLVCGYGTKIWWILGWAILIDLIFTLVYWTSATVDREPHPDAKQEFSFRLRLLDFPEQYSSEAVAVALTSKRQRKLLDALRVSSVILFKVGYRDTTVSGSLGKIKMQYVVALEWALGFFVLAALTVTLANTQPLINRLITGVF